jgi:hypothetical protein
MLDQRVKLRYSEWTSTHGSILRDLKSFKTRIEIEVRANVSYE